MLIQIGERRLADEMDNKGMTFGNSQENDESIPLDENCVDNGLLSILSRLGLIPLRSSADSAIRNRAMVPPADKPFQPIKTSNNPIMNKIAALYNGYRTSVLKKAASIANYMTTNPQLRSEIFGSSMAEAFAGGIDKVASASVLSPDSLAYLVGAYTNRDQILTNEVISSLAQTGAVTLTT